MSGTVFEARNELFDHQVNVTLFFSLPLFFFFMLLINIVTVVLWHA